MANELTKNDKTDNSSYSLEPKEGMGHYVFAQIDGRMTKVHVTDEVYKTIARMDQDEKDRIADQSRCAVAGKDGRLVRCTHKCSECPFYEHTQGMRNGMPVSPEFLMEEYDMDIAGDEDVAEEYAKKELIDSMNREISLLPEKDQKVLRLFSLSKTTREIATLVGMSQTGVAKRIRTLTAALRERLARFK